MPRIGRIPLVICLLAGALGLALGVGFSRSHAASTVPSPPFLPSLVRVVRQPELVTGARSSPETFSRRGGGVHHYEYVFPDREMDVFDIDRHFRLVERVRLPDAHAIRGVAVSTRTHTLYLTLGGDGGSYGSGSLLALDLLTNRILWERAFPTGVDSPALSANGRMLYLPTGERSNGDVWWIVEARDGRVVGEIHGDTSPHNTIVGPSGRYVYLGPRNAPYLVVASTSSNRVVQRIGPLEAGVRPFTIDGHERYAFTTATAYLGFQVGDIRTGKVLFSVSFPGFSYDPSSFSPTAPSHGIALSPDNRTLWVLDVPNSYVHEFDVSGLPRKQPRLLASVRLEGSMTGDETPCGEDCARDGWLQESADGRYLFVGDAGDVIDTRTAKTVAFLSPLRNSRYMIEIDWRHGAPVATTSRSSVGRA